MRLLALDTALAACSVAVAVDGRIVAHRFEPMARGHAERLLPMTEEVLAEAGLGWSDLDLLASSVGPGTFTGLRTGLATARGLSLALDLPLFGATTLDIAAGGARARGSARLLVVVFDAHGGKYYVQAFAAGAGGSVPPGLEIPALLDADGVADLIGTQACDLAGDGAPAIQAAMAARGGAGRIVEPGLPDAADLVGLALAGPVARGTPPAPLYLRPPDAKAPVPRVAGAPRR